MVTSIRSKRDPTATMRIQLKNLLERNKYKLFYISTLVQLIIVLFIALFRIVYHPLCISPDEKKLSKTAPQN